MSAALEVWVIYKVIQTSEVSLLKGTLSIINAGALVYFIRIFAKLVNRTFIDKDLITEEDLKKYFRRRLDLINFHPALDTSNKDTFCRGLFGEVLRMTEEILRNWLGPHLYELSVFSDQDHPKILAYYETGGQDNPRSKLMREKDSDYYKKSEYKVVELLDNPSSEVIIIPKTTDPGVRYKFLTDEQREKIKSTLLYCFCMQTPLALVVVCDFPDAINRQDSRLINLIHAVGMAMNCDHSLANRF